MESQFSFELLNISEDLHGLFENFMPVTTVNNYVREKIRSVKMEKLAIIMSDKQ